MGGRNYDIGEGTFNMVATAAIIDPKTGAPSAQEMIDALEGLGDGIAVRQVAQLGEALIDSFSSLPFEQRNKYKISALGDKQALGGDGPGWKPTYRELNDMPTDMMAIEDSSLFMRCLMNCCGFGNMRPLKIRFMTNNGSPGLMINRPFNLGGSVLCPHQMHTALGDVYVGKVEEDFHCCDNYFKRCAQQACCCTSYHDIKVPVNAQGDMQTKFKLEVDLCCCISGRCNVCGGTPCNNDAIFDIYEYGQGGELLGKSGRIQKTYAGYSCFALGRCCYQYDNYLLQFPQGATPEEKSLLMTALLQTEYVFFERAGNDDSNGGCQ
mmetsp:Transcript_542/g.643  ORF Transcript_542/g.643 Transcript_542/m.643 type:complete len:323 (+) Transcript_542:344-1312(+)|eukprot:CAMPEP_0204831468 /NCGR_PEP_ID=MMETSP1346-20131115/10782_1 /ASSEMBLY_ACC=CAM_ASM_000771 /TAXON_ID=215587 /ORGANISM="Aplanochytrium stocchinoi, Strain GSBS06" /LENGTH=322 /DNA_ID=CAMNT_0051962551 /DNA_START=384 /DNA_END=1352 /DNA_ORIENTATION=+